ncbi:uncharacterized protein LOC113650788 isoform X1 [Tachysurus ichikawai]
MLGSTPFQISHPISNPALPYRCKIPGGSKKDMALFLQGTVLPDGTGFTIDFSVDNDIAFHYKPQMGQHTTLNSFRNGNWDKQELAPDKPFTKGGVFQMIVAFNSEEYLVIVNGLRHCTFKHRVPLEKVSAILFHGDVSIQLIGFIENWRIA